MSLRCVHDFDGCPYCAKVSLGLISTDASGAPRSHRPPGGYLAELFVGEPDQRQRVILAGVIDPEPSSKRGWVEVFAAAHGWAEVPVQAWERTDVMPSSPWGMT